MSFAAAGLMWAALLAVEPVEAEAARREAEQVLGQSERFDFCARDTKASAIFLAERRWCDLAAAQDFRGCPGYARACEGGGGKGGMMPEGEAEGEQEDQGDDFNRPAKDPPKRAEKMPALGGAAQVLMWVLLALILIGAIVSIARAAVRGDSEDGDDELPPVDEEDASRSLIAAKIAARRALETDVERLLARAEEAEGRGAFEDAIADVYAAMVRRLEGEGLIHVDRWKTNGDYLRDLRESEGGLHEEVRTIVREVEQVQFGAAAPEQGRYRSIRAKVVALVRRASLVLALGLGLGGQLGCDESPQESARAREARESAARLLAGLGSGPADHRAVAELLLAFDIEVRHRLRSIDDLASSEGAIVVLDVELADSHWDSLLRWVHDEGGMLVIAGGGHPLPEQLALERREDSAGREALELGFWHHALPELECVAPPGRVFESAGASAIGLEQAMVNPMLGRPASEGLGGLHLGFSSEGSAGEQPYALRRDYGAGSLVVFAEPDLFYNVALSVADNAALMVNLFRLAEVESVEFIDSRTGKGPESPMQSVREAKLGPLFIQILLLLLLLYLAAGIPFTRLREPAGGGRRSFSEHVRTLGERYAQAKGSSHATASYSAWALEHLRARLMPGAGAGLLPLAQAIAARSGRPEGEVMAVLVQAHERREHPHIEHGPAADLQLMRSLGALVDACGRMS